MSLSALTAQAELRNEASYRTAVANGMRKVKEYPDEKNGISYAYAITRSEWEEIEGRRERHADY